MLNVIILIAMAIIVPPSTGRVPSLFITHWLRLVWKQVPVNPRASVVGNQFRLEKRHAVVNAAVLLLLRVN